jgi:hypothetical protein
MSQNDAQAVRGAATRLFSSTALVKYRMAISKNRMKKISMLIPCTVSRR